MKRINNNNQIYKYLCILSLGIFVITLGLNLYVSNRATIKGKDLQSLYLEKTQIEKDISFLEYEDSNLSSLVAIQTRATTLGFEELKEPLATISSAPLASLTSVR